MTTNKIKRRRAHRLMMRTVQARRRGTGRAEEKNGVAASGLICRKPVLLPCVCLVVFVCMNLCVCMHVCLHARMFA